MTSTHPTVHVRAGETSLRFTREFDAPAAVVFRAHVDVDLFVRWMGPRGTACSIEHFDAVTGGSFRYSVGSPDYRFFGSYHEVTSASSSAPSSAGEPVHRIVHTWEFVGDPGRPTLETLTFVDLPGGRCRLDGLSLYTSTEQCAEMLAFDQTGDGMDENFERIDELIASGALG